MFVRKMSLTIHEVSRQNPQQPNTCALSEMLQTYHIEILCSFQTVNKCKFVQYVYKVFFDNMTASMTRIGYKPYTRPRLTYIYRIFCRFKMLQAYLFFSNFEVFQANDLQYCLLKCCSFLGSFLKEFQQIQTKTVIHALLRFVPYNSSIGNQTQLWA